MTDHEIPWGMQIAVHYDKVHPPRRIDVAEAAARAVVALLASPRAAPGGHWHDAVERWRNGRIRKLVRHFALSENEGHAIDDYLMYRLEDILGA